MEDNTGFFSGLTGPVVVNIIAFILIFIRLYSNRKNRRKNILKIDKEKDNILDKEETNDSFEEGESRYDKETSNDTDRRVCAFDALVSKLGGYIDNGQKQKFILLLVSLFIVLFGLFMIYFGVFIIEEKEEILIFRRQWPIITSGIVTELIAIAVLLIYKSIFQQASEYLQSLERIIYIGLSMKFVNSLPEDLQNDKDTKARAKIEISKMLLGMYVNSAATKE